MSSEQGTVKLHPPAALLMIHDDLLVSDCLRGDTEAFRLLVERYRPRLHALANGILQDADLAADATQDAFLKAYESLPDYRARGAFGGWLRRILVNHCLTLLRQRHQHLSLEELDMEFASRERSPEDQFVAATEAEAIRGAMARLPAHYRTALVLRTVEGLSYREIAQLLAVPESTIESWIHRGRARMRTILLPRCPAASHKAGAKANPQSAATRSLTTPINQTPLTPALGSALLGAENRRGELH